MPHKKRLIGSFTPQARKKIAIRASETIEQRVAKLRTAKERQARYRSSEITEERNARLDDASIGGFAKQLLYMRNGKLATDESTQFITLQTNFCEIIIIVTTNELIDKVVFSNLPQNYRNRHWLSARSILAGKNYNVNTIDIAVLNEIPDNTTTYQSIDTVMIQDGIVKYPTEFLNSINLPGMPPYVLTLKFGVPLILLRNINPPRLYNDTRLLVKKFMINIIEPTILNGKFKGKDVLLPRIPMIPTDMPFKFKRFKFPERLKVQSLQMCKLNLKNLCFSYRQLFVHVM